MEQRLTTKYGDAVLCADGYYKISTKSKKFGGKLLHRLIYAEHYGVVLGDDVIIHHIDGNKTNNAISNLMPISINEHSRMHKLGENNPNYGGMSEKNKIALSNSKTNTGFFRVCKRSKKDSVQGFTWLYQYYDENGTRKHLSSVNLKTLEEKVKSKGLEWIILDEEKAKASMEM